MAFLKARDRVTMPSEIAPHVLNAPSLVPEINDAVARLGKAAGPHVINLSLLPHTEEDLALLHDCLGRGDITILSRGYGSCRITSTQTLNTWWVRYYNSQDTLILNLIEIVPLPEIACAASEDLAHSNERLSKILEIYR
jgi:hydrogenase-1 operon protein HyaF